MPWKPNIIEEKPGETRFVRTFYHKNVSDVNGIEPTPKSCRNIALLVYGKAD